jgi:hypothetical protein
MPRTHVRLGWLVGAIVAAACGTSDNKPSFSVAAATTSGSGGTASASAVQGVGGGLTVSGAGGSACDTSCSADLKKVLGCNAEVVKTCSGDEACLNGACTNDPCGAANAAKSSYGCDYFALKPDIIVDAKGACFAAYIANTWSSPVHIQVSRHGQQFNNTNFIAIPQGQGTAITYASYDPVKGLPPGEVAILFLSHQDPSPTTLPTCPRPVAINNEVGVNGTGRGNAFRITTDRPVVAYSILPYGGGPSAATSASLLLPTSAWDTNYMAVNAYRQSVIAAPAGAAPSLDVLAMEDDTEVTILPRQSIVGSASVSAAPLNQPAVYKLNAGEYVQFTQPAELTGSPIQSNKPVGVWGGASCLNVLPTEAACDSAHQQIPPIRALGSEYALVRYKNRKAANSEESPPWRVIGAVDGTQLKWQPEAPPGAPMVVNQGQVFEFQAPGPYVVTSQDKDHPFYAAQYMTGAQHVSLSAGEGDPEWVNVIPSAQYLDDYVFFTDPTYPETSLVVVRKKSSVSKDFKDVTLDCAGVIGGWQPLGNSGEYEYTRVELVTGDFENVGNCSNGRRQMKSDAPFGVTVWGWGGYSTAFYSGFVSYAYPAGASVQPINEVVVPPDPK